MPQGIAMGSSGNQTATLSASKALVPQAPTTSPMPVRSAPRTLGMPCLRSSASQRPVTHVLKSLFKQQLPLIAVEYHKLPRLLHSLRQEQVIVEQLHIRVRSRNLIARPEFLTWQ